MTWEEAQEYMRGPEMNGGVRAKVRRESWNEGQCVHPGGFPLYHMEGGNIVGVVYDGYAKVVSPSPRYMRLDTWKPTEEDSAATDWVLL
jgi:hypothetical protein